ncbi:MAG: TonB-dependent receptor [Opitutus sp.]|nr:TonB-dependent receptor [Opitutus sp.]
MPFDRSRRHFPAVKFPAPSRTVLSVAWSPARGRHLRLVLPLLAVISPSPVVAQSGNAPAPAATVHATATGTIEGRVFHAATGVALGKARVAIEGTGHETITDDSGSFRLPGVPAGDVRLHVSYLGLSPQTVTVSVPPGGVIQREFELVRGATRPGATDEVVKLQEFNVVADREMSAQAVAMNEQRQAPNLKSVVARDEFGDQGDESIMNFMRFLPGLSIADDAPGAGSVSLRGFPDTNTVVQFDGGDFASSRTANSRVVVLIEVPMSNVSRVEVTKVPTPDMPAAGLGGSINLISKTGFETKRPSLSYQLSTQFDNRAGLTFSGGPRNHIPEVSPKYTQPSYSLSYLHPVNKSLAISAGLSRTWRIKPMMRDNDSDETSAWDLVNRVQRISTWQNLAQVVHTWSGQFGADWRVTPKDTLSASLQYRKLSNITSRSNFVATYGAGVTGGPTFSLGAATAVGTVTQANQGWVDRPNENKHLTLKYAHRGDVWRLDGAGGFSLAEGRFLDVDRGYFSTTPSTIATLILRGDGIPAKGGNLPTRYSATRAGGVPVDVYDGANYTLNTATSDQLHNITLNSNARADLARDFTGFLPVTLKAGVSTTRMQRDERRHTMTWDFRPNGLADLASRTAGRFDVFDDAFNAVAPTLYGKPVRWISNVKVYQLAQQHPEWFVLQAPAAHQNQVTGSRKFSETISAAYLRADLRLLHNRLWIVTGVRLENTAVEGWGPLNDVFAIYQRTASGAFVRDAAGQRILITTDALARAKLQFKERGAHSDNDYRGYYPSFNATYNLAENLLIRAAYARTVGRPQVNLIAPGATITDPEAASPTITVSNTALKPWTADSFDLSLESYFLKEGFGSIGVFQKNIKDFFGALRTRATPELLDLYGLPGDPAYLAYDIVTQTNSGDAKVRGVEFSYRQSLTFLPHWARGFQVFANASKLWLDGSRAADFAGFTPSSIAGGINFIRPRFFIKANVTRQSEARRGLVAISAGSGIPADTYDYLAARTQWGVSAQYSLSKRYSVFLSANDIGGGVGATLRYAPGTPEYAKPNRVQENVYYTTIGVKGQF